MKHSLKQAKKRRKSIGHLAIVGSGITAVAHFTLETIGHIKNADIVFYHANSGVTATYIHSLNSNSVDLYDFYGEDKLRTITYIQMAELMLREVRRGNNVVGLFHGHPGYFVKAARRALAIAQMEGHETILLPGVSATDCLFADLRIDPGVIGIQILKASHVLRKNTTVATSNHVVLIQVASVGDNTFSLTGFKKNKFDLLTTKLISLYGADHDSVYYIASIFPGLDPVIKVRALGDYRDETVQDAVNASTIYLPPKGISFSSLTNIQAFNCTDPYGKMELGAIAALRQHRIPVGFNRAYASESMFRAMTELATEPELALLLRKDPEQFLARHPGLTSEEFQAFLSRDAGRIRAAATNPQPR